MSGPGIGQFRQCPDWTDSAGSPVDGNGVLPGVPTDLAEFVDNQRFLTPARILVALTDRDQIFTF